MNCHERSQITKNEELHYAAPTELWICQAFYYKYDAPTELWAAANSAIPYCKWYNMQMSAPVTVLGLRLGLRLGLDCNTSKGECL